MLVLPEERPTLDPRAVAQSDEGTCGWWSAEELFGDDPLLERVVGVEEQLHGGGGVFPDGNRHDVEQLIEVGGGGHGSLVGIEVLQKLELSRIGGTNTISLDKGNCRS